MWMFGDPKCGHLSKVGTFRVILDFAAKIGGPHLMDQLGSSVGVVVSHMCNQQQTTAHNWV